MGLFKMKEYSSGLVSQSFWYHEFKRFVNLLNNGVSETEIKRQCMEENLLGMSKEYRSQRVYGYIINRTRTMDSDFIKLFCNSDMETQKLINLITVLRTDKLFFEFIYEIYREKILLGDYTLTDKDLNVFINHKQNQNEEIALWKDVTLKRLKSSYFNFMTDANLLMITDKKKTITPPILDPALERYLKYNDEIPMLKAITGVR